MSLIMVSFNVDPTSPEMFHSGSEDGFVYAQHIWFQ